MKNTYQQTLDFLFTQLPMFQRQGAPAMKKNLDNILALCEALGNPQKKFKSIHIAGTNGKGSVTHILASVLRKAGLKVACYTSPHYKDFRERIKIISKLDGIQLIAELEVISFVEENKALIEKVQPSFFEITVAMAFHHFAKQEVDIAIIETGLGGRLDSTNIINPLLSIITNISKDHTQFLGETLKKIAGEKAGIIKKETPVIIGKRQEETYLAFDTKAQQNKSEIIYAEDYLKINKFKTSLLKKSKLYFDFKEENFQVKTDLFGKYQKENLWTALSALFYLQENNLLTLETKLILKGLKNIKEDSYFLGRNAILNKEPLTLADSAHNVAGIQELVKQISKTKHDKLHFVYGTVSDKDVDSIFTLLPKDANYYFCKPDIPRGMEIAHLMEKASPFRFHAKFFQSTQYAYEEAKKSANKDDLIIISGSIFVVAEVI